MLQHLVEIKCLVLSRIWFFLQMPFPNLRSADDPEIQAVCHTLVQELNYSYRFYNWPLYYKKILLCSDLNDYENRYKYVILLLINRMSEFFLDDVIKYLHPFEVTDRNLIKIRDAYRFYKRRAETDRQFQREVYSFSGRQNCVVNFLNERIEGQQHPPDDDELNGMDYHCLMRLRNLDLIEACNIPYVRFAN